jgi:Glycosyltransferase family 87
MTGFRSSILGCRISDILRYAVSAIVAVIVPLLLERLHLPIVSNTYTAEQEIFELFGLSAGLMIFFNTLWELKRLAPRRWEEALPVLLPAGVALLYLLIFCEYPTRSYDYNCYERAANEMLAGRNPYKGCYYYPPLLAQALALGSHLVDSAKGLLGAKLAAERKSQTLFYLYECIQFGLILVIFRLCVAFARRVRLPHVAGLVLVTALFALNNPLLRCFRHNQGNTWVLMFLMAAILLAERRPGLAGASAALGAHVKLYPLALLGPWMLMRRWRALFGTVLAAGAILAVQAEYGKGVVLWRQYIAAFPTFPRGSYYRDNSIHSLVHNALRLLGDYNSVSSPRFQADLSKWTAAITLVLLAWLLVRFVQRERIFAGKEREGMRLTAHSMDAIAAMLIVSPMVWEHHYVLILPVIIWAAAAVGREHPWALGAATFLMICMPTFDLFPLSSHRLAGLLWLLVLTSPPRRAFTAGAEDERAAGYRDEDEGLESIGR